jgi:hypothetical protein
MNRATAACFVLAWFATPPAHARTQAPRVELDHVFIVVTPGATAEMAALRSAGLTLDSEPSRHEGQGTASVAVFFENAYLELIWVDSSVAVDPEHASTSQWFRNAEAWRTNGRSPFGLGLRRLPGDTADLPVPVQLETAAWLPADAAYELLHQPSDTLAADFFVVPASTALPTWVARRRERAPEQFEHPGGGRRITLVRMHGAPEHEPTAFRVLRPTAVESVRASAPLVELQLDGAISGQRVDLRPVLPLVLVR